MTLEQQVVSLELAKKMKELGFEQESLFYWQRSLPDEDFKILRWEDFGGSVGGFFSAYTVAELGEMLPFTTRSGTHKHLVDRGWWVEEWNYKEKVQYHEYADTEANSRAKMLIYLKENNLI